MVMMHELAHCMQMNHSGAFWKVRNQYAEELRGLWAKGYTGDGFWGRGKTVLSEKYESLIPVGPDAMPRSLCGGTFRSRGRKRRRRTGGAEQLTYAARKQQRIAKKFGTNGMALGCDEEARVKLEDGQKVKAKPKVAGSNRGRELRAAAALARFVQQKEEEATKAEAEVEGGSETDDDYGATTEGGEAVNIDGSRILDSKGHRMTRVCEDEDPDDVHVKKEMRELQDLEKPSGDVRLPRDDSTKDAHSRNGQDKSDIANEHCVSPTASSKTLSIVQEPEPLIEPQRSVKSNANSVRDETVACAICSMANEPSAVTCMVCSHVLDLGKVPGYWQCYSPTCAGSKYINVADSALCGVCGARRLNRD